MKSKRILITALMMIAVSLLSFWAGMYVVINKVGAKKVTMKETVIVEAPKIDTLIKK